MGSRSAVDGQIGRIDIEFKTVWQAVVQLEIGGVLAKVGILGGLKAVELVKELKVESAFVGDISVVRVKGHLSAKEPRGPDREEDYKNHSTWRAHQGAPSL